MPTIRHRLAAARAAWKTGRVSAPPAPRLARRVSLPKATPQRLRPTPQRLWPTPQRPQVDGTGIPLLIHLRPDWRQNATAIAGILSVLLVAAGLFYSNEANRKQQDLIAQGQITERFNKALDQLGQEGDDKLGIRLGAVYGLKSLMRDSPDDEPAIIQVLCAFIRRHAAPTPTPSPSSTTIPSLPDTPSPLDVQAAVTVLANRPRPTDASNATLDLSGTQLSLPNANLRGAYLSGAYLGDADLGDADLGGAHLDGAHLDGADLSFADLRGADLRGAYLHRTDLGDARLGNARLGEADLRGADLSGAHLSDADLSGADLSGAHLTGADLSGADLNGANMRGAYLSGAYLYRTDLRGVFGLTSDQLIDARRDDKTKLPANVAPPTPSPSPSG
jgi:hypothetical protein